MQTRFLLPGWNYYFVPSPVAAKMLLFTVWPNGRVILFSSEEQNMGNFHALKRVSDFNSNQYNMDIIQNNSQPQKYCLKALSLSYS